MFATLHDAHAAVQLLAARLGPRAKSIQHRATEAVTALVLLVMLTGSAWVFILLLPLDERSDLLGLPIAPARFLWSAALLIAVCLTAAGRVAQTMSVALRGQRGRGRVSNEAIGGIGVLALLILLGLGLRIGIALVLVGAVGLAVLISPDAALIRLGDIVSTRFFATNLACCRYSC